MSEVDEGGTTKRSRLLQVYNTTGVLPQLLSEQSELDIRVEPFYIAFLSISRGRRVTFGAFGGSVKHALTPREILDWMELEKNDLGPFGISVIHALDAVYLEFENEKALKEAGKSGKGKKAVKKKGRKGKGK